MIIAYLHFIINFSLFYQFITSKHVFVSHFKKYYLCDKITSFMWKTRRGGLQWVLHLVDCRLFYHQGSERQKDRYLCLKRSPPWRSSAFSRLSMAILQVRLAFLHEVWLLESEGSHVSFCQSGQVTVSERRGVLPRPGPQSPLHLHTSSSWLPQQRPQHLWFGPCTPPARCPVLLYCPVPVSSLQGSQREQSGHSTSVFIASNGFRVHTRLGHTRPCSVKSSITLYGSVLRTVSYPSLDQQNPEQQFLAHQPINVCGRK